MNAKRTGHLTLAPTETLIAILDTLPDALFFLDASETVVYMNAKAQTIAGATQEKALGDLFWRCAPHLVSPALYRAVRKTKENQAVAEAQYVSPVTQTWLYVKLSPTAGGLTLQFHEGRTPAQPQETASQHEPLYTDVLDSLQAGIAVLTLEGIVLEIHENSLYGAQLRREEVIGKPLIETPWWSRSPTSQAQLRAAIARASQGETARFETLFHPREGSDLHLEVTITPHMDANHHAEYLVIAGLDITARKRAEADSQALIETISQLVWTGRPDGYVDYYNQRWLDYTGMTTEEALGYGWMQCTHPDDRQRVLEVWQRAVQTGSPYETQQRLRHGQTGEYRWFLIQATPYTDAQGTILKYVGTCTDIDEQKRAKKQLKISEQNFRTLAETVPQLVWTTQADGRFDYCNQRYCEYTQATFEQLKDYGWRQFLHPEDAERIITHRLHTLETGEPFEDEYRLRNGQTGTYRWFLGRAMPIRDDTGQIIKWFGTNTDIHETKQTEDKLRHLINAIPQFVWIAGPDGYLTYNNQRLNDYLAMTQEQSKGSGWLAGVHPDDRQRVWDVWQTSIRTGNPYEVEHRMRNGTSGEDRWFLVRGEPQRNAEGTILHWVGTCTDIEGQKRAEQELKESRESWRVLAETVPHLVWAVRPDGLSEYFNQRFLDYTHATREQLYGYGWSQFLHPEDYERTLTARTHAIRTGTPYEVEYRLKVGQTGEYRWFLARAMPVRDEAGQIVKWFGTCTDIEDQKRTEQQLKESRENWRVLAETVPHLVWTTRPNGHLEYANQRARGYVGACPEYMLSDEWRQFIHPDDYERVLAVRHHALETGGPYEIEYRLKESRTGTYRWFLARALPVRDDTGLVVKWISTGTDIEEQKRTEEALRTSQERVDALMNSSIIGINIAEGEQIVDANGTFLRMTGYTREDLRAGRLNWMQMTPPEYVARTLQADQELTTRQVMRPYEKEYICKDGNRLPVLVGRVVLAYHPHQTIAFVLDNSARKELERRKDDFINMASHELKTPLTALKMQSQLVQKRLERQSHHEAAALLSRVENPIKQLERLTGELLDVSKIQAGRLEYQQEPVDLDALLHEIADSMQQISPTHTLVVRGAINCSLVGDKDRLGQVFINLISNAIKYSPGAETVEIDLSASAEAAIIRIQDHGLGIPQEQRDKIFERFYRVSSPNQKAIAGLGMGLYIVAEIVRHHGGSITVESEVGKGSTFQVELPLKRPADPEHTS